MTMEWTKFAVEARNLFDRPWLTGVAGSPDGNADGRLGSNVRTNNEDNGVSSSSLETRRKVGLAAAKKLIVLAIVLGVALAFSTNLLWPVLELDQRYLGYFQIAEVAVIGYFAIGVISKAAYKLAFRHSEQLAKTVSSLNKAIGAIVVIAVIISYLSRDPVVAVSIGTVSGIVVGFASQNIIGNLIAGMYLVIARPFRIGDRIIVFDKEGTVSNIELLYSKILMDNGDLMLAPNIALVTTSIILHKRI